jgi:signal transduction histidine kinase
VLEVEDTGCGVSINDLKILFNAYQQVSTGVTKTFQGTGLGLHICKSNVEILNGIIVVGSTKDKVGLNSRPFV